MRTVLRNPKPNIVLLLLLLVAGMQSLVAQTPPTAVNDTIRLCEGTTVLVDVLANDTDADGEVLETDILAGPSSVLIDYEDDGLPEGQYWISIESGFTGTDIMIYEVCGDDDDLCDIAQIVIIVAGAEGCVWPGDANQDSICNYIDLLPIGIYYGLSGPDRDDDDGTWEESFCDEWDDVPEVEFAANPKFADCNGDGLINDLDTITIQDNYGQLRGAYIPAAFVGGTDDPELYFGIFSDTVAVGTAVTIPIYLGSDVLPASDIYGIAFEINYDTALVDESTVMVSFSESWLGDPGTDVLYLQNNVPAEGKIEVAITRNNQIARTGSGYFGQVSFVMEDNIAGKTNGQITSTVNLCLTQPLTINAAGLPVPVQISCDSVILVDNTNNIPPTAHPEVYVFPNPADDVITVQVPESFGMITIDMRTLTGQIVHRFTTTSNTIQIPAHNLAAGSYIMQVNCDRYANTYQCIIQH